MVMSNVCGDSSPWSKFAFILLFPSLGFHCAGLGTVFWMKSQTIGNSVNFVVGLWKMMNCTEDHFNSCIDMAVPDKYNTHFMYMTKATEITTLTLMVLSLILSAFYMISARVRIQKTAAWIMMLEYMAVGFSVFGCISWSLNIPEKHYVHWSLGLTVIAASMCAVSATLMIADIRKFDYDMAVMRKVERKMKRKQKRTSSRAETRRSSKDEASESLIKF